MAVFPQTILPLTVPSIECWFDALNPTGNRSQPADSSQLSSWYDSAGKGNTVSQATSANQPIFIRNIYSGRPTIRFNGTSQCFTKTTAVNGQLYTLFIVCKSNGSASHMAFYNGTSGGSGYGYFINSSTQRAILFGGSVIKSDGAANTNLELTTTQWTGSTSSLWVNASSVSVSNSTTSMISPSGEILVGRNSSSAEFWNGDICEIILYSRALSTGEMKIINSYLANKWRISI